MSWGSSKLATDLGLPGHSGPVAVIGAGVMGLTTARLVQEAGFPVTIYAEALPPDTTSNIAGGQISPFGHYREDAVTPEWRRQFMAAMDYSWRRFQIMVGDDYGVRWLPTYRGDARPGRPTRSTRIIPAAAAASAEPSIRSRSTTCVGFDTMYVETGRFLRQTDARHPGRGRHDSRSADFASAAEHCRRCPRRWCSTAPASARATCSATRSCIPVRGQLAMLLPQPEVRYAFTGGAGYMFPRADGIMLGGTFERDEWDATSGAGGHRPHRRIAPPASSTASAAPLEVAAPRVQSSGA